MMLKELSAVPDAALPVEAFRAHLRLGSGFAAPAAGTGEDALLRAHLRAAIAAVEARTGKVLLSRTFEWKIAEWREVDEQALPLAPVAEVAVIETVDRHGEARMALPHRWRLIEDMHRPRIVAVGYMLPGIPTRGHARVEFLAGFGGWEDVPADLRQAVLMLGAQYHDDRAGEGAMPAAVGALVERWRTVRTFGGAIGGAIRGVGR
ncbi:head-tail connector protein [Halodurantibacterium flavum]|uniref:PhiE125 gp8 family phage protein n=1 Tax=Halodurantibacterium flavum TaxID=1382802 RepID=A0ABW4S4U2_9RHOB